MVHHMFKRPSHSTSTLLGTRRPFLDLLRSVNPLCTYPRPDSIDTVLFHFWVDSLPASYGSA